MFEIVYNLLLIVLVCAFFAVVFRGYRLQHDFYEKISGLRTKEDARRFEAMAATQMKLALLGGICSISALLLFVVLVAFGQLSTIGGIAVVTLMAGNGLISRKLKTQEKKLVQLPASTAELEARRDYLVHVWHKKLWPNFEPYANTSGFGMFAHGTPSESHEEALPKRVASRTPVIYIFGALIVSAATVPVLMGLATQSPEFARSAFLITAVHALLALPLVLILRRYKRLSLAAAALSGILVGIVPVGIWSWPLRHGDTPAGEWVLYAQAMLPFGVFGAISGAAFWMALRGLRSAEASARWVGVGAGVLAVALLVLPYLTKDRSCHNLFRDGRYQITPMLNIDLSMEEGEWGALRGFYQDFAIKHELNFTGEVDRSSEHVSIIHLSMCKEPGLHVRTNEQEWHDSDRKSLPDRGVSISVFRTSEQADWRRLARSLVSELNREFPERVRFRNGTGKLVPLSKTRLGNSD